MKFHRHKFHISVRGFINVKKEAGDDFLKNAFAAINSDGQVIKKMMLVYYDFNSAITAKPVDKLDYPKYIVGLA